MGTDQAGMGLVWDGSGSGRVWMGQSGTGRSGTGRSPKKLQRTLLLPVDMSPLCHGLKKKLIPTVQSATLYFVGKTSNKTIKFFTLNIFSFS
jgi:hypothetical protein